MERNRCESSLAAWVLVLGLSVVVPCLRLQPRRQYPPHGRLQKSGENARSIFAGRMLPLLWTN